MLYMAQPLKKLLSSCSIDVDGIYSGMRGYVSTQTAEIELRERVAAEHYDNYLEALSASHSIPVMDHEVDRFLAAIPQGGLFWTSGAAGAGIGAALPIRVRM
jgi:hypothetical protein